MKSHRYYLRILEKYRIRNYIFTLNNTKISIHIFRHKPASIKGKVTRKIPKITGSMSIVPIPDTILDHHPTPTLAVDYIYVQSIKMMESILVGGWGV